jgi:hypothetical protein
LTKSIIKLNQLTLPFTIDSLFFLDTSQGKKLRVVPLEEVAFLSKKLPQRRSK